MTTHNDSHFVEESCPHLKWLIVQPWELLRKYRCSACDAIAMCECDQEFARRLPHQANSTRPDGSSPARIPVTHGFLPTLCPTCRGEKETAFPTADGYGSPSRLERYYWREIAKAAFLKQEGDGFPPAEAWLEAKHEIEAEHRRRPRYEIEAHERGSVPSDIRVIVISAPYAKDSRGHGRWLDGGQLVSVEQLASARLSAEGWEIRPCERALPASLYATFMLPVLVNTRPAPSDTACFGARDWSGRMIPLGLLNPSCEQLLAHIETIDQDHFDLDVAWVASAAYREYLWVREPDCREIVDWFLQLAPHKLVTILKYLASGFWNGISGWPDLIGRRNRELHFFEVKSPGDRPSEDQIRWFSDNKRDLGLAASLVKVRRESK